MNQMRLQCKSSGTDSTGSSFTVDSQMSPATLRPYVDIRRLSGTTAGDPAVSVEAKQGVALLVKGKMIHFDTYVMDYAPATLSPDTSLYVFSGSGTRTLNLPPASLLDTGYGESTFLSASIKIEVVQHTGSSGSTTVRGSNAEPLLNNNGGYMGGSLPGQITLYAGDCYAFRYIRGGWYVTSSST
jgi:hypothetical protein